MANPDQLKKKRVRPPPGFPDIPKPKRLASGDEEFLVGMQEHIEDTLEKWMDINMKMPMEATITRNLTDFNKTLMGMESRHHRRWRWVMTGLALSIITNITLITVVVIM